MLIGQCLVVELVNGTLAKLEEHNNVRERLKDRYSAKFPLLGDTEELTACWWHFKFRFTLCVLGAGLTAGLFSI